MANNNEYWHGAADQQFQNLNVALTNINSKLDKAIENNDRRFDAIERKMATWIAVGKTLKFVVLFFVALITLKIGSISDIATLWVKVQGGS